MVATSFFYKIIKNKKLPISEKLCARDWIRTSTPFPAPPPQGGASTNFATRALEVANLADKLISKKVKSQK
jgi:hypothetical protein